MSSVLCSLFFVLALAEHAQRQVEGHAPVPRVDNLADPQIAGLAAQDVGILAIQSFLAAEPDDHVAHGVLRVLHQIWADRGSNEVAFLVVLRLDRTGRGVELVAPRAQAATLQHVEAQAELHRALDSGGACRYCRRPCWSVAHRAGPARRAPRPSCRRMAGSECGYHRAAARSGRWSDRSNECMAW